MANIKQVAQRAGLSVACVSKYLKNSDSVLPTSKAKIEAAIAELNYTPSPIARSLRMKKTRAIMIMLHSITNPYFSNLFEHLRENIESRGYSVVLQIIGDSMAPLEMFEQVDGAIMILPVNEKVVYNIYSRTPDSFPLILCHARKLISEVPTIILDLKAGMYRLTEHCIERGCRRFAYIGRSKAEIASRFKLPGFVDCLEAHGIGQESVTYYFDVETNGPFEKRDFKIGFTNAGKIAASPDLPEAIICENDMIALGCTFGLTSNGVNPNGKILIAGSDNIPLSEMTVPPITTLDAVEECSEVACQELFRLLNGEKAADHIIIPKLIAR